MNTTPVVFINMNSILTNTEAISNFFDRLDLFDATINIFAIDTVNSEDVRAFLDSNRDFIQNALGVTVRNFVTARELIWSSLRTTGINYNTFGVDRYAELRREEGAFEDYCIFNDNIGNHYYLISDSVPNRTVVYSDTGLTISTVRLT